VTEHIIEQIETLGDAALCQSQDGKMTLHALNGHGVYSGPDNETNMSQLLDNVNNSIQDLRSASKQAPDSISRSQVNIADLEMTVSSSEEKNVNQKENTAPNKRQDGERRSKTAPEYNLETIETSKSMT